MITAVTDLFRSLPWFTIAAFAIAGYYIATHGLPAFWAMVKGWFSTASADVAQIKSVFSADIAWLEASVLHLASVNGTTLPPKAVAKPATPAAAPAAPV